MIEPTSLKELLDSISSQGGAVERNVAIQWGGSTGRLLLNGAETPFGILILAKLFSGPKVEDDFLTAERAGAAKCAELVKFETDTARELMDAVQQIGNPISSIVRSSEFLTGYTPDGTESAEAEIIGGIGTAAKRLVTLSTKINEIGLRLVTSSERAKAKGAAQG